MRLDWLLFITGGLLLGLQMLCWPIYRYIMKHQPLWKDDAFIAIAWIGWCGAVFWAVMATILLFRSLF